MQTKRYMLSIKAMLGELMIIPFAVLFMAIGFFIGWTVFVIFEKGDNDVLRIIFPGVFFIPVLIIVISSLAMIFGAVGRAIFSYLAISENGLEYRLWPALKIRCGWGDIDQVKKSFLPLQGELLMLKQAEVSGFNLLRLFKGASFDAIKALPAIPLYQMNGWRNGKIKDEMKKYAPHLFPSD